MRMETHVECTYLSSQLEQMVIERYLIKNQKLGSVLSYEQLEKASCMKIRKYSKYLPEFSSDICTLSDNLLITSNESILEEKKVKYIRNLLHKLIVPLSFKDNDFHNFWGRFIEEYSYNENEKQFMDEAQNNFFNICKIDVDDSLIIFDGIKHIFSHEKMKFFRFMSRCDLRRCIRPILNKIAHKELQYGDDITELLSNGISADFFQKVNPNYTLFFECRDSRFFLACDTETNKHLFWFYFFLYLVWDFQDISMLTAFILRLHILYCPIIADYS